MKKAFRRFSSALTAAVCTITLSVFSLGGTDQVNRFTNFEAEAAGTNDIYVGFSNKTPNYGTVQEAVNAASKLSPSSESQRVSIHIAPGTYREQILVNTPYISFINDDPSEEVKLTWYYGIGYLYYSADAKGYYSSTAAAAKTEKNVAARWGCTVNLMKNADYFRAENITFENSFNYYVTDEEIADGVELNSDQSNIKFERKKNTNVTVKAAKERAAAITIEGDKCEFFSCDFLSSQDTLYTGGADGYFKDCLIEGTTDYIYGSGNYVFDSSELRMYGSSDAVVDGVITAQRPASESESGYLFIDCLVTQNSSMKKTNGYYGRPWGADAKAAFINTTLQTADMMKPAGWTSMSGNQPENANFREYNTKSGGKAVDLSKRTAGTVLSSATGYSISDYLGAWSPYYLNGIPDIPDTPETVRPILDAGKLTEQPPLSAELKIDDTFSIMAASGKTVTIDRSKTYKASDGKSIGGIIKLGGSGNKNQRSIKINADDKATLDVYMMSSNADTSRKVNLLDSSGNVISSVTNVVGSELKCYKVNIPASGTYYLTSAESGLNIAYIEFLEYSGEEPAPPEPTDPPKPIDPIDPSDHNTLDPNLIPEDTYYDTIVYGNVYSITANADKPIIILKKNFESPDGLRYESKIIDLRGTGKAGYRSIKINADGRKQLKVNMMSSNKTVDRTVDLLDSNGNVVDSVENVAGSEAKAYTLTIPEAGTYYLASRDSGLYVCFASITDLAPAVTTVTTTQTTTATTRTTTTATTAASTSASTSRTTSSQSTTRATTASTTSTTKLTEASTTASTSASTSASTASTSATTRTGATTASTASTSAETSVTTKTSATTKASTAVSTTSTTAKTTSNSTTKPSATASQSSAGSSSTTSVSATTTTAKKTTASTSKTTAGTSATNVTTTVTTTKPSKPGSGDVDKNGKLELKDIVMMQKYLINKGKLTDIKAADVNGDGRVNVFDLIIMIRLCKTS